MGTSIDTIFWIQGAEGGSKRFLENLETCGSYVSMLDQKPGQFSGAVKHALLEFSAGVTGNLVQCSRGEAWRLLLSASSRDFSSTAEDTPNPKASAYEDSLCRLFQEAGAIYGYSAWNSTTAEERLLGVSESPYSVVLDALIAKKVLQLYPVNFFSNRLLHSVFPSGIKRDTFRVRKIDDGSTLVSCSHQWVWNPIVAYDLASTELGIDQCWQSTGSADRHDPRICRLASGGGAGVTHAK